MPAPLIAAAAGTAARAAGTRAAVGAATRQAGATVEQATVRASKRAIEEEVQQRKQRALESLRRLFKDGGEELEDGHVQQMLQGPPEKPQFPVMIASMAVLKDILDSIDATGFGIIVTTFTTIGISLVIALWMLGKMSGGWWKGRMIKWFWNRYLLMFIVEFIPFLKFVPATTVLVLMAHYKETRVVKLLNSGLEILHGHGFKGG